MREEDDCWRPKCNICPKCNKVLNVITLVLNVISLQYNRLTALVNRCYSGHSNWIVLSDGCCTKESSDPYSWHIAGSLILISVFLFARDVGRETLPTNPYSDVLLTSNWQTSKKNENADQYLSLYHWLRLFSATDFDDILVWSMLKLTLYEPNYKEKEVH